MKKILIISLSIVLMLGLVACGNNVEGDESIKKEEPVETHHPDAHHSDEHLHSFGLYFKKHKAWFMIKPYAVS